MSGDPSSPDDVAYIVITRPVRQHGVTTLHHHDVTHHTHIVSTSPHLDVGGALSDDVDDARVVGPAADRVDAREVELALGQVLRVALALRVLLAGGGGIVFQCSLLPGASTSSEVSLHSAVCRLVCTVIAGSDDNLLEYRALDSGR